MNRRPGRGLPPDHYAWVVVHREHGSGVHMHVLAARCDLETSRSLWATPVDVSLAGALRAVRAGAAAGRTAERARDALCPGLQDALRDVMRALEVMRQADQERGPERDFGPSR